ncbi:MAG: hypothetical protein LC121_06910, partial [Anaerolineae bacterium]|nr:hypothetical protein [Anaerolineae bacterium]
IGQDAAAEHIRRGMRDTLERAAVRAADISAVGVGVAGASASHSSRWLDSVVRGVLPEVFVALSSDFEIALVGAHGQRYGLLILAGTGSAVYAVNARGESAQVGGWGYLLGDEGSGYWIGVEALRALTDYADERSGAGNTSRLPQQIMETLDFDAPRDVINWLYTKSASRVADVAKLAELVLTEAADGDTGARQIVARAAAHLAEQARAAQRRLHDAALPIAFAGGLLEQDNWLRRHLCAQLGLSEALVCRYPPVVGAALLAQQRSGR